MHAYNTKVSPRYRIYYYYYYYLGGFQEFKYMRGLAERQRSQQTDTSATEQNKTDGVDESVVHNYGYFTRYSEAVSPFDTQVDEEQEEDLMETNGVSTK